MKLTDIEKRAINDAVTAFVKHCADAGHEVRKSSKEEYSLASDLFNATMTLITGTDYGDPEIEQNLHSGTWATPAEVINYLESLPDNYYQQTQEPQIEIV